MMRWCLIAIVLALCSCSVGPDYERPVLELPNRFVADGASVERELPLDPEIWWRGFSDPVLDEMIERAVRGNIDLRIARARVRQARALVHASRSGFLPRATLETSYSRAKASENALRFGEDGSESGPIEDGDGDLRAGLSTRPRNLYEASFDAIWEIDIFGGTRREVEAAIAGLDAEIEAGRDTLLSLLAEVAQAYFVLRASERQLTLSRSNVRAQEETLEIQRMRLEAGLASELSVAQAETQLRRLSSSVPRFESRRFEAIQRLSVLLGTTPAEIERIASRGKEEIPEGPGSVSAGVPSDLLRRRPDVRRAERLLAAATANIGVAVADLFPRLELNGDIGARSLHSSNLFEADSKFYSFGPSLRWEILNWVAILSNIELQTARQEEALVQYERTVLLAIEEVEDALYSYRRDKERADSLARASVASRHALNLAQDLHSAGLVDFLNVLVAQLSVFEVENELTESELAAADGLASLYKALGGGWRATGHRAR